jgi:hypothetical protein
MAKNVRRVAKRTKTTRNRAAGRTEASSGQPKFPYCTSPNSLRRFLGLVPDKPKPPKVTTRTLKAWGFTSSNDFSLLRVLKNLDLLSSSGEPSAHYVAFMKKDSGAAALGIRVRQVYAELFQNVASPERASNEELRSFFNIHSGGDEFMECVRYLNVRRSAGLKLKLESEADVQDAIYLMLRPWMTDLVYESPTEKVANRFVIRDFLAKSARTVIEAKFVRDETHGRQISKELHDDIEMYRRHPGCDHLVFFIYDANSLIPDVSALKSAIESSRVYEGQPFYCHVLVKP